MTRKIRIFSVALAILAVLGIGGAAIYQYNKAERYERVLNVSYSHALSELVSGVNNISTDLQKCLYSGTTEMICGICTDIYGEAKMAGEIIGELPFYGELEKTAKFLNSVGDYAYVLSKSAATGEIYTDEQYENIKILSDAAEVLANNLNQLMYEANNGELTVSVIHSADAAADNGIMESMGNMESEFPEIPTLIYDGPFSEHIQTMKPVLIDGADEITESKAVEIAADFIGITPENITVTGKSEGNLPVYMLETNTKQGTLYVEVTVQGGIVLEVMNSRTAGEAAITQEEAVKLAEEYLQRAGYDNMAASYYMTNSNVCTVNFAYVQDDVMCYTDLIKVSVALDNGEITGFETMGYVMSHRERTLPDIKVAKEDAQANVSNKLRVIAYQTAVIPTDGKYEIMCHEFKCEASDGRHYITYVNVETGREERILSLIESESGTLVK